MPAYESISRRRHAAMHNYAIMHIGAAYLSILNSARVPSQPEKRGRLRMRHSQALAASLCKPTHCAEQPRRTCFSGLRKSLFRLAEEPFLRHVKGCSGVRKRLCDEPERAFPHHEDTGKACPDSLYSRPDMPHRGGRAFSALLRFLFHEKLLSIFFTFTNA